MDKVLINNEIVAFNGFSSSFSMTNGYRRISSSGDIKDLTTRILYYAVNEESTLKNEDPSSWIIKSELEIVVRANKSGMSSFIQAFINIFAVGIWMIIAFFNQSYNKQDSIGMIGTGLFAAISSILVGVSMISDANIFSLITMINIFTLAIILIMAYESIAAKRASVKEKQSRGSVSLYQIESHLLCSCHLKFNDVCCSSLYCLYFYNLNFKLLKIIRCPLDINEGTL